MAQIFPIYLSKGSKNIWGYLGQFWAIWAILHKGPSKLGPRRFELETNKLGGGSGQANLQGLLTIHLNLKHTAKQKLSLKLPVGLLPFNMHKTTLWWYC